jgi:CheY-like chemotaxis protein/anti-sigma regulatory factor (Ser/Thr protein kinase)
MPTILVVDDERAIRLMLADYLEETYAVLVAETGAEAISLLEDAQRPKIDLIISDINMPGMGGLELLRTVRRKWPSIKQALITAYNIDEYIKLVKYDCIANIIPKTVPFNFLELETVVTGLITGKIFGLKQHLLSASTILGEYCITSSDEGKTVREQITELFTNQFGTSGDMRLVLDEIITNAIYHAPGTTDGAEKYESFSDVVLEKDEYVYVECGFDQEKYAVSITDSKGRLSKEKVLDKLERQLTGEGVLDNSGRGIHMSRIFADRMIINIDPSKKTEVIVMNYFIPTYRGYKPLYINEL